MAFAVIESNSLTSNMETDYIADLEICQEDMNDVVESLIIELEKYIQLDSESTLSPKCNDRHTIPESNTLNDKLDQAVSESSDVSTVLLQTNTNESSNTNDDDRGHQSGTQPLKEVTASESHPKYSVMISDAITSLKSRSGSSRQAILKYIKANYEVTHPQAGQHLNMALKAGINKGSLIMARASGKGMGSFKLVTKESKSIGLKKLTPKSSTRANKAMKKLPKNRKLVKKNVNAKKVTRKDTATKLAKKAVTKKPTTTMRLRKVVVKGTTKKLIRKAKVQKITKKITLKNSTKKASLNRVTSKNPTGRAVKRANSN